MLDTSKKTRGSTKVLISRLGATGAPEGSDNTEVVDVPPMSTLISDPQGRFRAVPYWTQLDAFALLPAATAAATADPFLLSLGTGTEVVARSAKGGIRITTQASSPANNDNVLLVPNDAAMTTPITAITRPRFSARVSLPAITLRVVGVGLDENVTSPIPNATAGDGAAFYFDPLGEVTLATMGLQAAVSGLAASTLTASGLQATFTSATAHGLTTGNRVTISGATQAAFNGVFYITVESTTVFTYTMASNPGVALATGSPVAAYSALNNWILTEKVNGTDTFIDSGVPVVAGLEYDLEIEIGADLYPKYYINGALVGTGASPLTSGDTVKVNIGLQQNDSGTPAQESMDVRYVMLERFQG